MSCWLSQPITLFNGLIATFLLLCYRVAGTDGPVFDYSAFLGNGVLHLVLAILHGYGGGNGERERESFFLCKGIELESYVYLALD